MKASQSSASPDVILASTSSLTSTFSCSVSLKIVPKRPDLVTLQLQSPGVLYPCPSRSVRSFDCSVPSTLRETHGTQWHSGTQACQCSLAPSLAGWKPPVHQADIVLRSARARAAGAGCNYHLVPLRMKRALHQLRALRCRNKSSRTSGSEPTSDLDKILQMLRLRDLAK